MRANEIMSTDVVTVRPDTPIKEAAALLVKHRINALPVTTADGSVIGIVSERDLLPLGSEQDPRLHVMVERRRPDVPTSVAEVMTTPAVTMPETSDVADVARAMLDAHVKQIPIVSGTTLVGIIARRDLLNVLARDDAAVEADARALLEESAAVIGRFAVKVEGGVATLDGSREATDRRLAERLVRCVPGVISVRFANENDVVTRIRPRDRAARGLG